MSSGRNPLNGTHRYRARCTEIEVFRAGAIETVAAFRLPTQRSRLAVHPTGLHLRATPSQSGIKHPLTGAYRHQTISSVEACLWCGMRLSGWERSTDSCICEQVTAADPLFTATGYGQLRAATVLLERSIGQKHRHQNPAS